MSYRAGSTISQDCEWGLFISLWNSVCNSLWIKVMHNLEGEKGAAVAELFHRKRRMITGC
jgi:hypothetical protein